jgi:hypothetical protein
MVSLRRTALHEAGHAVAGIAPHLHRGRYQPQHDAGLECMCVLCLCGPASERFFCGPINDGSDQIDYEMARHYLSRQFAPLRLGIEIARLRDAAERLVRTPWAQHRIESIDDALLEHGTLSGADLDAISDQAVNLSLR